MRNWPYAWVLAQAEGSAIRGKVGVALPPRGEAGEVGEGGVGAPGRHAAALGGEALAVSKYSKHPELAASLVLHMTSAPAQKARALQASFNPTRPALYGDANILKANPFMGERADTFRQAVPRPTAAAGARQPGAS